MAIILNIETSTTACSVALAVNGETSYFKVEKEGRNHSELLGVFVDQVISWVDKNGLNLDAVAVSAGPGSYTGLRIGVSLAKGLCFGYGIPLIAVDTLQIMALRVINAGTQSTLFVPMIDARRMEVYSAVYAKDGSQLIPTQAEIVHEHSYHKELADGTVCFFGDGADKCKRLLKNKNAFFLDQIQPLAMDMPLITEAAFHSKNFVDVAYFEPHYLKEFLVTTSKKDVLGLGKKKKG